MEQLKNPQELVWASRRTENFKLQEVSREALPVSGDPFRAWMRLTEVRFDPAFLGRNQIILDAADPRSHAIDMMRTRTLRHMRKNNYRRLAITSASAGSGKSTTALNLALSLGRRQDLRTILFDFNLRNPALILRLGLMNRGPKYSALLGARRNFDTNALRLGENLAFSLAGSAAPTPAELLGSSKTADLIDEIEEDLKPDLMIFDTSALSPTDDAIAALGLSDCALLVARADVDTIDQVDTAEQIINEHSKSLGVILNDCQYA